MNEIPKLEDLIKEISQTEEFFDVKGIMAIGLAVNKEYLNYISNENYIKEYVTLTKKVYDEFKNYFDEDKAFELTKQYLDLHLNKINNINYKR